jgi:hypothetical protein
MCACVPGAGHDLISLVFNFMDELLYIFGSDSIIVKDVKIVAFDQKTFSLTAWWCVRACVLCGLLPPCCCWWGIPHTPGVVC